MATLDAVFGFSDQTPIFVSALAAVTASGELVLGNRQIFAINADQDITILLGRTGMIAPTASNFRIPQNVTAVTDLGSNNDRIRVFNLSTTTAANVYIQALSRF